MVKQIGLLQDLTEKGRGITFDIDPEQFTIGFVVLFEGEVYGYVNRCPHVGTELDWVQGEVFNEDKTFLMCATHGALFDVKTGRCVNGPCINQSLIPLDVVIEGDHIMVDI